MSIKDSLSKEEFEYFSVLLWFAWWERNKLVYGNPVRNAYEVLDAAGCFLFDYQQVRKAIEEYPKSGIN